MIYTWKFKVEIKMKKEILIFLYGLLIGLFINIIVDLIIL